MNLKANASRLIGLVVIVLLPAAGSYFFLIRSDHAHTGQASVQTEQLYTRGMHPQVIQKKPGNCPICGMKLTPIRKQSATNAASTNAPPVATATGERNIKYYKSTMLLGEISQTQRKDSMGMDMVPVYEDETSDA